MAFEETPTLLELVQRMVIIVKIILILKAETNGVRPKYKEIESKAKTFYPSVECGPLSIRKAKKYLKWKPTPIVLNS